jgi:hypothetical protein
MVEKKPMIKPWMKIYNDDWSKVTIIKNGRVIPNINLVNFLEETYKQGLKDK